MRIAIDGNEANIEKGVGVNVYALNVLKGLHSINKDGKHSYTVFLNSVPHNRMPKENENWRYVILNGSKMWILMRLVPYLWLNYWKFDLFFTPSHYIPPFVKVKRVCSVMDLGYLENSGQFTRYDYWQLKWWTAYSIKASKAIITISAQSERDIVRHYPKSNSKIFVTHLGYDSTVFNNKKSLTQISRVKKRYDIVGEYLLFLSTLKPSKNIDGLIRAWAKIEKDYPNTNLVIAGRKGWLYDKLFSLVEDLRLEKRIVFTGFIDEEDKEYLLKGAKAFVLPSFWEGFGLDVVSAMASGIPTIISNRGSLPEVGGEAALYVDPYNVADIAEKIEQLLKMNKKDYNMLIKKGTAQASKFSWEKTSRQTLKVLESIR